MSDNTTKATKQKSKSKPAIIALVVALVLCVIAIIGLVVFGIFAFVGGIGIGGGIGFGMGSADKNNGVEATQSAEEQITELTTFDYVATTTSAEASSTQPTEEITQAREHGYNTFYITYDTPYHAGVNLRETPDDNSVKIMVLSEGTVVTRLYAPGETAETKYIKVAVDVDGKTYTGYVMQRYVSIFSGNSFDSHVSYNTPSHAGLVLRETNSADSRHIMVIPEGTELRVVDNSTGAYWAVEAFYEGEIYCGYVLSTYIESNY